MGKKRKEKTMPHVGIRHGGQRLQGSKAARQQGSKAARQQGSKLKLIGRVNS